jgi:WD40 repeat protein/tRNA A-37 threonylcarbamoyl transferase component Bud32
MPGSLRGLCPRCMLRFTLSSVDGESRVESTPLPHSANRLFGDYELVRELGRGGMGVVYEARHLSLNRTVALKMLHPSRLSSSVQLQRFRQEAEAVAALDHPNILPVYEVGSIQGQPYFTMKFAERGSVADAEMKSGAEVPASGVTQHVTLVVQIARAVHYAHQRGIQHRDLKPHNILIDAGGRPYVADFGLAKFEDRDSSLTLSTDVIGSPAYMSPEQAAGDTKNLTTATDIYGLGAILYELLTGQPPFAAGNIPGLLRKIAEEEPDATLLPNPDLRTVCLKCLSKDPQRRYSSAEALADELERWLRGEPVQARPVSGMEHAIRWCRRRPALATTMGALLVALIAGVAGISVQWRRAEQNAFHHDVERYAADLQVASQALAGHDLGLARRVLAAQIPREGQPDLRGFEWHLLQELCKGQHGAVLTGHTATVTCVAISPDGTRAVSGGMDATLHFWDLRSGISITNVKAHGTVVWSVAFTPDGRQVVSAGADGKVLFWTNDGQPTGVSFDGVNAALSGDGSRLATSMSTPFRFFKASRGVTVWDWHTRRVLFETNAAVRRVALSPDGQWLAGGGERTNIFLWNLNTGETRQLATADSPWAIAFSPDGKRLAAAGFNMGARVWNLQGDLASPFVLSGHQFKVWGIAFSPDSRRIVTSGSDRTLQIRSLETPDRATVLDGHDDEVWDVAWSRDDQRLVTASKDMSLHLWPARPAAETRSIPSRKHWQPQFSRSGQRLLTLNDSPRSRAMVALREVPTGKVIEEFHGRWIAGFGGNGEDVVLLNDNTGELEHWRSAAQTIEKGATLENFSQRTGGRGFAMSQDGTTLVITYDQDSVIWNIADGRVRGIIPRAAKDPLLALSLSPHGDYFAYTVTAPYTIWLHHLPSGRTIELKRHTEEVKGLDFAPDGRTLASAGVDRVIRLWNTTDGKLTGELVRYFEEASGVSFSPDGRLLASVGIAQSVNLWHLPTLREVFSLTTPEADGKIAFSPAGDAIAFSAEPNMVRLLHAGDRATAGSAR